MKVTHKLKRGEKEQMKGENKRKIEKEREIKREREKIVTKNQTKL